MGDFKSYQGIVSPLFVMLDFALISVISDSFFIVSLPISKPQTGRIIFDINSSGSYILKLASFLGKLLTLKKSIISPISEIILFNPSI